MKQLSLSRKTGSKSYSPYQRDPNHQKSSSSKTLNDDAETIFGSPLVTSQRRDDYSLGRVWSQERTYNSKFCRTIEKSNPNIIPDLRYNPLPKRGHETIETGNKLKKLEEETRFKLCAIEKCNDPLPLRGHETFETGNKLKKLEVETRSKLGAIEKYNSPLPLRCHETFETGNKLKKFEEESKLHATEKYNGPLHLRGHKTFETGNKLKKIEEETRSKLRAIEKYNGPLNLSGKHGVGPRKNIEPSWCGLSLNQGEDRHARNMETYLQDATPLIQKSNQLGHVDEHCTFRKNPIFPKSQPDSGERISTSLLSKGHRSALLKKNAEIYKPRVWSNDRAQMSKGSLVIKEKDVFQYEYDYKANKYGKGNNIPAAVSTGFFSQMDEQASESFTNTKTSVPNSSQNEDDFFSGVFDSFPLASYVPISEPVNTVPATMLDPPKNPNFSVSDGNEFPFLLQEEKSNPNPHSDHPIPSYSILGSNSYSNSMQMDNCNPNMFENSNPYPNPNPNPSYPILGSNSYSKSIQMDYYNPNVFDSMVGTDTERVEPNPKPSSFSLIKDSHPNPNHIQNDLFYPNDLFDSLMGTGCEQIEGENPNFGNYSIHNSHPYPNDMSKDSTYIIDMLDKMMGTDSKRNEPNSNPIPSFLIQNPHPNPNHMQKNHFNPNLFDNMMENGCKRNGPNSNSCPSFLIQNSVTNPNHMQKDPFDPNGMFDSMKGTDYERNEPNFDPSPSFLIQNSHLNPNQMQKFPFKSNDLFESIMGTDCKRNEPNFNPIPSSFSNQNFHPNRNHMKKDPLNPNDLFDSIMGTGGEQIVGQSPNFGNSIVSKSIVYESPIQGVLNNEAILPMENGNGELIYGESIGDIDFGSEWMFDPVPTYPFDDDKWRI